MVTVAVSSGQLVGPAVETAAVVAREASLDDASVLARVVSDETRDEALPVAIKGRDDTANLLVDDTDVTAVQAAVASDGLEVVSVVEDKHLVEGSDMSVLGLKSENLISYIFTNLV